MRDAALRLWRLYHTPGGKKMFRYTMVSVVSTAVAQLTLLVLYGGNLVRHAVWANVIANAVATAPSYYLNRKWAWGKSGKSHLMKEIVPFWVMSFAGMFLSVFTVAFAEHWGKTHGLHHFGLTVLVQGANLSAFGVLWVVKFMVMNKLFHHSPAPKLAEELVEV